MASYTGVRAIAIALLVGSAAVEMRHLVVERIDRCCKKWAIV